MSVSASTTGSRDELYQSVAAEFGAALVRLARAYEFDAERRQDLLQEIHFAIWRSFANYDARCSLRTWVYRVAHNTATTHVLRQRRVYSGLISIEEFDQLPAGENTASSFDRRQASERLALLIQKLKPLDRQVILSYLEGLDAATTAEITGLSAPNVAMKIHRIKGILAHQFHSGENHAS